MTAVALLCMSASSCAEWLDVEPVGNIPTDSFYRTPVEAEQALIGVYNGLLPIPEYYWHMCELRSDNVWNTNAEDANAARDYYEIFTYSPNLAIVSMLNDAWLDYYAIISRANLLIEKLADADFSTIDEESDIAGDTSDSEGSGDEGNVLSPGDKLKESFEAEARTLRAFAYFDLVRFFGRVPVVTSTQTVDEAMATGQSEPSEVYEQVIIPDLEYAIEHLDETAYDSEGNPVSIGSGRVNNIVAHALLGRVYATMTGFPMNDESKKELAMKELKTVIDYAGTAGKYWAETSRNWEEMWLSDNDNKYFIWEIQYIAREDYGNPMVYWMVPNVDADYIDLRMSGYNLPATDDLLALYSAGTPEEEGSDVITGADIRRNATFNFYEDGSTQIRFFVKFFENKHKLKELGYPDNTSQIVTRTYFPNNFPLIRLEDMMLLYAELSGAGDADAVKYVNDIRKRAGIGELTQSGLNDFASAVDDERRRELAGEGARWFDLVRHEEYVEKVSEKFRHYGTNEVGTIISPKIYDMARRVTEDSYLYPIPDVQMKVKEGLYQQNPGY